MRPPKEKDIGLIFDIVISNTPCKEKSTLDLRVRGDTCCLELMSDSETFCCGPKLFGGYFGKIEPGAVVTVSAIWPTSVLFNRKGSCDVTISSSENSSVSNAISDKIYFDTNISAKKIPAIMNSYMNRRNISNCCTIDLNPFQNCLPMNCEEKYFGRRNYFNAEKNICEIVPKCTGLNIIYNYINNECVNIKKLVTDADIEMFKSGKISNKTWDIKRDITNNNSLQYPESEERSEPSLNEIQCLTALDALVIATTAMILYLSVCFCIFICFNILTKRKLRKNNKKMGHDSASRVELPSVKLPSVESPRIECCIELQPVESLSKSKSTSRSSKLSKLSSKLSTKKSSKEEEPSNQSKSAKSSKSSKASECKK